MRSLAVVLLCLGLALADHDRHMHKARKGLEKKQTRVQDGDIRLVDGPNRYSGRVEIYHAGEWGTVCDDWWETADAQVVCRELNFSGGEAHQSAHFGEGTGQIWKDNVECTGTESALTECSSNAWGDENCSHGEDASVVCEPPSGSGSETADVRLVNGPTAWQGRVEVYHDGQWGTVCDDSWDSNDAAVVCRQLGYSGGVALEDCEYGEGSDPIWLDEVMCSGSESSLSECSANPWGDHNCGHYEDAGVDCTNDGGSGSDTEGAIRLANGPTDYQGRVEIYHDGQWGTVCDDAWDADDAAVVCRQLGYSGGVALEDNEYGDGVDPIWLDEVECTGSESSLSECQHRTWGEHNCGHYEDAGVDCDPTSGGNANIRLVNGENPWQGRVEVLYNGEWGTVCDDYWEEADAQVVCRQLGYTGGVALEDCEYGEGTGNIWLDDVGCTGSESSLDQCSHREPWGDHNCGHHEDAGVECDGDDTSGGSSSEEDSDEDGDVRLVNGPSEASGRVEVFYGGRWGTICDDRWDSSDAEVICRQLGYMGGEALVDLEYGEGTGDILLDDVECTGAERSIADCGSAGWGIHNCGHFEDAGVNCVM